MMAEMLQRARASILNGLIEGVESSGFLERRFFRTPV